MRLARYHLALLVLGAWFFTSVEPVSASIRQGISLGFGIGAMSADDEDAYLGIGSDLYPEGQLAYDLGPVRFGLHVGYLWRKEEVWTSEYRNGRYSSGYSEQELAFMPVEFDVCFMPVRFARHGNLAVQPYVGIGLGTLIAEGDNTEDLSISPVVRAGIDFYTGDWSIIGLDVAYHAVGEADNDADYSYTTFMLQYRFRVPIVKRHEH